MSDTPLTDAAVIDGATWLAPARELYLCSQRLELACAAKDALIAKLREALERTNKFIEEAVYCEAQTGPDSPPEPADSVSMNAVSHLKANTAVLAATPETAAAERAFTYGIRADGSIWISVGNPDYRHAQCDIELPEWALQQIGATRIP